MTMTVFDFENREVKIELSDKPIKAISVTVLSSATHREAFTT